MKKQIIYAVILSIIIAHSSCSSSNHITSKSATAHTRNITQTPINETTTVTDLVVDEKKVIGSFSEQDVTEEYAKNMAVYDAVKKSNADVLIEPAYTVERNDNNVSATVSGFPGRYKNFRSPTSEDSLLMGWKVWPKPEPVKSENSGSDKHCCCNGAGGNINNSVAPTQHFNLIAPTQGRTEATPQINTEEWRTKYLTDYNRLHKKGKTQLAAGIALSLIGIAAMASSSAISSELDTNGDNTAGISTLAGGGALLLVGTILWPTGVRNLIKARNLKRGATANGTRQVAFTPGINIQPNNYSAGFAMNF